LFPFLALTHINAGCVPIARVEVKKQLAVTGIPQISEPFLPSPGIGGKQASVLPALAGSKPDAEAVLGAELRIFVSMTRTASFLHLFVYLIETLG
jgi:hypothetical protein